LRRRGGQLEDSGRRRRQHQILPAEEERAGVQQAPDEAERRVRIQLRRGAVVVAGRRADVDADRSVGHDVEAEELAPAAGTASAQPVAAAVRAGEGGGLAVRTRTRLTAETSGRVDGDDAAARTAAAREQRHAVVARRRERVRADRTVADRIAVRRVEQPPTSAALDGVVGVVTQFVSAQVDAALSAQPRSALGLHTHTHKQEPLLCSFG